MIQKHSRVFPILLILFIFGSLVGQAQNNCSGLVKDFSGLGLPGVNVAVKGTISGTVTDIDGKFTLSAKSTDILIFSMVGFLTEEIEVGTKTSFDVMLLEDIKDIGEVVVIGYGTVKKSDVTGSVSSVQSEELVQLATANVAQAMQGRASGVMVVAESGEPGSGMKVRVRGTGTINKSDPLYVVDGFPTGNIDYLSPNDIESIDILKDASATAIYGNRGANGVVLVTTKKGNKEKTVISFNMYTGIQNIVKKVDVLNATEYAQVKTEAYRNAGQDLSISSPSRDTLFKYVIDNNYVGTDWQDAILQQGAVQSYNLNVTGGGDKYKYFLSGTYNKENGIVQNSFSEKYFFRSNNQYEFSERVKGEVNVAYSRTEKSNYDFNDYSSPLVLALLAVPITPVYDENNISELNPQGYAYANINARANPVAAIERMNNSVYLANDFISNASLEIKIVDGLVFTSRLGSGLTYKTPRSFSPTYYIGQKDENSAESSLKEDFNKDFNWNLSNFITYNKEIGIHNFSVMVGQEMASYHWEGSNHTVYGIPSDPALRYVSAATGVTDPTVGGYIGESSLYSYFGRVNYSLYNKYLATVNIRRDASSKIAEDYRWGTFPSFALAWKISEEDFMSSVPALSNLKLRAGYGKTGNEGSIEDPYSLYATLNYDMWMASPQKTKIPGAIQTMTPNEKLQWETQTQYNFAMDYGFFDNMLTGSADFFVKNTEDMIVDNNPPLFNGMRSARFNFGSMTNRGIELNILYKQVIGEFAYEVGGNITFLDKPIVTRLASPDYQYNNGNAGKVGGICRVEEGSEFAYFNGYQTDGLLTQDDIDNTFGVSTRTDGRVDTIQTYEDFMVGDPKLIDQNGDGKFKDADDKVNLGSANPDYFYGINLGASYKGFDFKLFIQGVGGVELVNGITSWLDSPNQGDDNLSSRVLNSYGFNGNTDTETPRLEQGNSFFLTYFTDLYVQNGSYLRLKNLQIGYTLPNPWLEKVKLSNCRIYASVDNLLTFTEYNGFDPEVGRSNGGNMAPGIDMATYPVARKVMFGVNVSF